MAAPSSFTSTMAKFESRSPDSEKSKKYDRQIRLWGDHGQAALEASHVCLIHATAIGTEVLKGLVLPGIGAFTIVDSCNITGEDAGNKYAVYIYFHVYSFFLDKDSIGKNRGEVATRLLMELNPHVRGDSVDESVEFILDNNPSFFTAFTVVIATNVHEKTLLRLGALLWGKGVPLVVCRSYGFIGYIRLQISEHCVIESHPDNEFFDLRLDRPFDSLRRYVDSVDMNKLTHKEHSHTPYIVILLKALDEYQKLHGEGVIPKTFAEKKELKEIIRKGMRPPEPMGDRESVRSEGEEENFEEATKVINMALGHTTVPSRVQELFDDISCEKLTPDTKSFWIMLRALRDFVRNEGKGALPVRGTIPDMTSDSDRYVQLFHIYHDEAEKDIQIILKRVQDLLSSLSKPLDCISEAEVRLFCKNAHCLEVTRGRSLAQEYDPATARTQLLGMELNSSNSDLILYALLRGVDRFYAEFNRFPGFFDDQLETDINTLKQCVLRLFSEWGISVSPKDDYIHEMCRYGASELHTVAAFVGGCAAHEVIKLCTGQYVPIDNTLVFNAETTTTTTFAL